MRRASDSKFVFHEGVLVGINLGADFTAEHEQGIREIKESFGIHPKEKDFGLVRRKITNVRRGTSFGWTQGCMPGSEGFYLVNSYRKEVPNFSNYGELRTFRSTLACAWDTSSFGVFSSEATEIVHLHQIFDAFRDGDGAIFLGGTKFIENAGLVLCIASRLPAEVTEAWEKADRERYEIEQEVKATGIRELLAEKGKHYFALSRPHHNKDGKLTLWLNPQEQHINNYGYFTIDDLRDWAEGKGKIPKSTEGRGK